uniref:KRAB domain-containing zinc finger protein n=1 Tax=Rhipicephalus zambeziensis TaxID=60191 RepID=A0A224Z0K0_9ACAR
MGCARNRCAATSALTRRATRPTSRTTCGCTAERNPSSAPSAQTRSRRGRTFNGTCAPTSPGSLGSLPSPVPPFGKRVPTGRSARGKGRSFLQWWSVRDNSEDEDKAEGTRPRKFHQVFGHSSTGPTRREKKAFMRKDPLVCGLCSYTTHYATHMKDHMRTHSGEKPFKCTKCSAAFTQAANCKRHLRTHHS